MDNQDYLTDYRLFFDNFYQSFEKDNPLPVHIGKYNVAEFEIVGEVICWCLEYLNIRKCPSSLIAPLCRSVIVELQEVIRRDPESCGYRSKEDDYQTLKLMQVTIRKLNEVCLRYRDNSEVSRLPPPPPVSPSVSAAAVKNGRRTMEDCHIVIHDLHALFGIEGYGVASYYAVFDGHIGSDAALYSCSHIYQYLVESQYYPTNPEAAFKEAFIKTDERFIDKSNKEKLKSGTTAVCILIRHDLGKMYVAWLGDSQAILVNGRDYIQLVNPHRPEQFEEKERIEAMGGSVVFWGTWRVNGQLAVSRAIGDVDYKPYVTAEPDVTSHDLTGDEDFLLLACDGLWDVISEKHAVDEVYKCLELHKGDRSSVSQSLVQAAKSLGSKDNISVVVAWLDMSTLENGHFVPGSEVVDSVDDLLPPVLRSLKPATQTIAPPGDDSGDVGGDADSGDDSDEEWNYISGKENRQPNQHTKQELTQEEMESQLNPNAAEFVPVYGRISPTSDIDIVDISRSPAKPSELKNLENVVIPTPKDFYNEISKRPAEIDDLCETDATLNGGELNDISTKAVFGDDSITLNSAIDSSLVQSESLKSTNPFAPSQVPNFVQDHFSAPNVDFKPFNDSKPNDHEYDFMVENDKPDLLSPNEPTLEVYKSGQTDLSGIIFGDGVNVDDIVRSKQDSPLLRESPEPGLHNGQVDHEDKPLGLENATPLAQETDNLNINVSKEDISPSQPPKSPLPSEPVQEDCGKNISEIISEHALETPEIGPETSVDSESEDDVLVSPKIKERSLGGAEKPILVEDPICSLAPAHETDVIENSMTESALEMVDVYHKDDEEEDLICPLKQKAPESYFNSVSEAALESMQMPESASTDVTPDATSDFEIVNEHGEQFNSEAHLNSEEVCPMKLNDNEATSEQLSHPEEVKEVFSKVEVHEDLICPMKETPLLQESLKNSLENEDNAEELEEITANLESHESIPEQKIEIQLEKSVHEDIDVPQENKDVEEHLPLEKDTDAEETLVCSVKKESDNVFSSNRDEICHDEIGDHISHEEDLVCPINKKEDLVYEMERIEESVCSIKKDDISVSPVQKAVDDLFCPITKDDGDLVCSINKDDVDLICSTKKENDNLVCPIKNEIDDSVANKKDDTDLVCPVKEENDLVCPIRKEENDDSICPIKKEENDDLVCPIKKEENDDIVCPIKKEDNDDIVSPNKKEENDDLDLVSSIKKEENEAVFALEKDDLVCTIKKDTEELACPIKGDNDELVCPIKKEAEEVPSSIEKDDLVCPTKNEDELICPDSKEDTIQSFTNFDGSFTNEIHQNTNYEESIDAFKESSVTSELKEHVLSEVDDLVSPVKAAGDLSHEVVTNEKLVFASIVQPSKEEICRLSFGIHQSLDNTNEVCSKTHVTKIDSEFSLESSEKVTEEPLNNVEVSLEDAVVQNVGIVDEMSSSMIDHGEDKCLPEAQSNQLDLVQDLQFNEAHEKAEPDTESDSGFEIINASEASTIEMEMRIQSEKEAGAADEKLHLDKNEAEVQEKTEAVSERLQEDIKSEENERKTVEPVESKRPENEIVVNGASADTPATPPATPAPGLLVENKEGLIAAAVAAAGVATAVAGGTAVVKVAETKPEEKKKPPTPKKTEPTKTAPGAKPAAGKPSSGKPTAPAKAAAPKPSAPSAKLTSKPTSPATKTALAPAKPSSKPSTPTTKVPAKPTSKPSTPTGAKPATPTSSTALKSKPAAPAASKPAAPAASKPATTTSAATRTAAKPSSTLGAAKKPAPTPASKPASTGAKPAVSSTVGARPAAKLAAPASALKSASPSAAKTLPTKPPTPTSKAPAAARPPSAKSAVPSKPPTSSAPTKAPPKPAPAKAPASKPPTTTSAKAVPASKTLAAKPTAPAKPSAAPLNKKPAAPTAIKKPAAPTDKSVKEANNKLASAKTAVKKVEDKKIVSKKEEIAENEIVLPTQEPVVTTTNGHITLIENGIPTPEIVAE